MPISEQAVSKIQIAFPFGRAYAAAAVLLVVTSGSWAKELPSDVCKGLARLLSSPLDFQQRSPIYFADERNAVTIARANVDRQWAGSLCHEVDGPAVIPNVDVDGDGLVDSMYFDCSGSGSISKPDACKAEIRFGGGRHLQLQDYLPLVMYGGKYYAIDAEIGKGRTLGIGAAYRITKTGLQIVCRKL